MAVQCPDCGRQYDVTLFQFGQIIECDCGAIVSLGEAPTRPSPDEDIEKMETVEVPIDGQPMVPSFMACVARTRGPRSAASVGSRISQTI